MPTISEIDGETQLPFEDFRLVNIINSPEYQERFEDFYQYVKRTGAIPLLLNGFQRGMLVERGLRDKGIDAYPLRSGKMGVLKPGVWNQRRQIESSADIEREITLEAGRKLAGLPPFLTRKREPVVIDMSRDGNQLALMMGARLPRNARVVNMPGDGNKAVNAEAKGIADGLQDGAKFVQAVRSIKSEINPQQIARKIQTVIMQELKPLGAKQVIVEVMDRLQLPYALFEVIVEYPTAPKIDQMSPGLRNKLVSSVQQVFNALGVSYVVGGTDIRPARLGLVLTRMEIEAQPAVEEPDDFR